MKTIREFIESGAEGCHIYNITDDELIQVVKGVKSKMTSEELNDISYVDRKISLALVPYISTWL